MIDYDFVIRVADFMLPKPAVKNDLFLYDTNVPIIFVNCGMLE